MKTAHDLVVAAKQVTREITVQAAAIDLPDADLVLDVREADEYNQGHIPGALHMSRGMLEFKLAANPAYASRDLKIVVYCKTSGRAALCAKSLQDMGYTQVRSIAGGMDAWVAEGMPVAKPSTPSFE